MATSIYAFSLQIEIRNYCFVQANDYDRSLSTVNEQQCSSIHMRYCNILYFTEVNFMCLDKCFTSGTNFSPNEQFSRQELSL